MLVPPDSGTMGTGHIIHIITFNQITEYVLHAA